MAAVLPTTDASGKNWSATAEYCRDTASCPNAPSVSATLDCDAYYL